MKSTQNYLWETEDVLGQGATASVYKARNKKSGELVAVKVFNNASYLRPQEVQIREFEVLRKLNHHNIVKLFAVEEIESSKQKVLVMEFCSGGSLLTLLEEPENAFGLSESEFLIVLRCVVSGMNHLRENGIVHRDIKPGNIMRLIGEDRQSVYKLTDFGAARELDDDEKFVSVYGTEEYLHPDIYKRAVLKKPQQRAYGATVDLWSIGVTFYHAATGNLPFIPFGGPRKNKEIMYKITTEKPAGAIAGIQRQENGTIDWTYELPVTCQLSFGLRRLLVPILANILEADQEQCWGFDQFFAETSDILHRTIIHVFCLPQAVMHWVYIHRYNTATLFLEEVFRETNIAACHQEYFFEGHSYALEPSLQAHNFPRTTENCPLIMLSTELEDPVVLTYSDPASKFPKFLPQVDVLADCSTAKDVVSATYYTLRVARSLLQCQELVLRGLYWMSEALKTECLQILEKRHTMAATLTSLQKQEMKIVLLYETVAGDCETPELKGLAEIKPRLQSKQAELQLTVLFAERSYVQTIVCDGWTRPLIRRCKEMVDEDLSKCSRHISEHQAVLWCLLSEVEKRQSQLKDDRSILKMEACLDKMQLIYSQFKKARKCPRLLYNEQQIHKLDKVNLGHLAKKVLSVFQDDSAQQYRASLLAHGTRMRKVFEMRKHLKKLNRSLTACNVEMSGCQDYLYNVLDELSQRVLQDKMTTAPSSQGYLKQKHQAMMFGMQELQEQMKIVANNLQLNNSIIQRLNGFTSTPDL